METNRRIVLDVIRDLGLEHSLVFNKGALMVLPPGINKGTGLAAALDELRLSARNVVAVGDGENDHALIEGCECSVAVANAVDTLIQRADLVTREANGAGVAQLAEHVLSNDLSDVQPARRRLVLGTNPRGEPVTIPPYATTVLIAGPSGSGKSREATALIEHIADAGYQLCILDPEGDYDAFEPVVTLGDGERYASPEEAQEVLLDAPRQSISLNLVGLPPGDRPAYLQSLLATIDSLQRRVGRPHWLVMYEAHHFLPSSSDPLPFDHPGGVSLLLLTVTPEHVAKSALASVDFAVAVGRSPLDTLSTLGQRLGEEPPPSDAAPGEEEAVLWDRRAGRLERVVIPHPRSERRGTDPAMDAGESRKRILRAIEERYTLPA
jgi:hypothetical protein